MGVNWSKQCSTARDRPASDRMAAAQTSVYLLVAAFAAVALCSFAMLARHLRAPVDRWKLYGRFLGLLCAGNLLALPAWAAVAGKNILAVEKELYRNSSLPSLQAYNQRLQYRDDVLSCVYQFFQPIGVICLHIAYLMVLSRLLAFVARAKSASVTHLRFYSRAVMVITAIGDIIGVGGNFTCGSYLFSSLRQTAAAEAAFASGNASLGTAIAQDVSTTRNTAYAAAGLQPTCEAATGLLIVAAFIATAVYCSYKLRAIQRMLQWMGRRISKNRTQDVNALFPAIIARERVARRIYCTVAAIFSTTLLRAVFSLMNGIGSQGFKDRNVACDDCDAECMRNIYVVMAKYLYFTPEFESTVVLLASPFASCVALFCMRETSDSTAHVGVKNSTIEIKIVPWHSKTSATSEASGGAART